MDQKVENIVISARKMFLKFGVRSVSMDDISHDLGISKKTLYLHFGNKNELLEKVLEYGFEDFEKSLELSKKGKLNAIDSLLELSRILDVHLRAVNPSVTFDLEKYYPDLYRQNLQKRREYAYQYIRQNIENGIQQDLYRSDLNSELISKLYIQKLEDLHDPNYYKDDKISFTEVFQVMFENHIRGISNENGIKYFEEKLKSLKSTLNEF